MEKVHPRGASGEIREDEYKRTIIKVSKLNRQHQNRGPQLSSGQAYRIPVYWVGGVRHIDGVSSDQAFSWNCGNLDQNVKGESQVKKSKTLSTNVWSEDGRTYTSVDDSVMESEQRSSVVPATPWVNSDGG
jgi:hypothetical protein